MCFDINGCNMKNRLLFVMVIAVYFGRNYGYQGEILEERMRTQERKINANYGANERERERRQEINKELLDISHNDCT